MNNKNYLLLSPMEKINYKIFCLWEYSEHYHKSVMKFIIESEYWINPYWQELENFDTI